MIKNGCGRCGNDVRIPIPYGNTHIFLCDVCSAEWVRKWSLTRPKNKKWVQTFNKFIQSIKECVIFT